MINCYIYPYYLQFNRNMRPDPDKAFPNPAIPSLCYIKNVVKNPNIIVGDYTYYDDKDGAERFEEHVAHFYPFIGDELRLRLISRRYPAETCR